MLIVFWQEDEKHVLVFSQHSKILHVFKQTIEYFSTNISLIHSTCAMLRFIMLISNFFSCQK